MAGSLSASGCKSTGMMNMPQPSQQMNNPTAANSTTSSFVAISTPNDRGKCPPLYSSVSRDVHSSNSHGIKSPLDGASNSNSSPTHNGSVDLGNLTAFEEEEIQLFTPNVYYAGIDCKRKIIVSRGHNEGYDDENGHYRVVMGDHIAYRYEILKELGRGTFGVVVKAFDHKSKQQVAVKVIKGKPSYTKQAKEEVKILELLGTDDSNDAAHVVRLLDTCTFRGHFILVFELLGMDLYSLCQQQQFKPMSMNFIYELSAQLLVALEYSKSRHIIHCDVKPENIVVSTNADNAAKKPVPSNMLSLQNLKLIDFGSACLQDRRVFSYIQSRYYRAPEIVLGISYTSAIDMWSFGCVLCELANGYPIFPASGEGELLERIIEYLGPVPPEVLAKGKRVNKFYDESGELRPNLSKKGRQRKKPFSRSVQNFLKPPDAHADTSFVHLVTRCFEYNPQKRITPREALEHPWMQKMSNTVSRRG